MRQTLQAGGVLDLLTKDELHDAMGHSFNTAIRAWLQGVDYLIYTGQANGNTFTIPYDAESGYSWSVKLVGAQLGAGSAITQPTPTQPAVPATGVAQQNTNAYPVQVVISANGATITNVSVNGVTVGTAAGTYTVPAFGSISIAYTVATPTWVWSNATPVTLAVPVVSVYLGSSTTTGLLGSQVCNLNAAGVNETVFRFSANQCVIKDSRQLTLFSAAAQFTSYTILLEQVPTEMQGKL